MKKNWISIAASVVMCSSLLLTSCGGESGENANMPPESTHGDTRETGADITGDVPGTGAEDTTGAITGGIHTTAGSTTATTTTAGTDAGTTTGTTSGTTSGATTDR